MAVLWPARVDAQASQSATEHPVGLIIGALISDHPTDFYGAGSPYLDNALGGTVLGLSVAVDLRLDDGAHLTIDVSSTAPVEVLQRGRFVTGPRPAVPQLATHRDTFVSFLPGVHVRFSPGGAAIEPKGGLSLRLGTTQRGTVSQDDVVGSIALTAGFDVFAPINRRVSLVPAFRYSYAARGDGGLDLGLSPHVIRVGVGLRFGVGR